MVCTVDRAVNPSIGGTHSGASIASRECGGSQCRVSSPPTSATSAILSLQARTERRVSVSKVVHGHSHDPRAQRVESVHRRSKVARFGGASPRERLRRDMRHHRSLLRGRGQRQTNFPTPKGGGHREVGRRVASSRPFVRSSAAGFAAGRPGSDQLRNGFGPVWPAASRVGRP